MRRNWRCTVWAFTIFFLTFTCAFSSYGQTSAEVRPGRQFMDIDGIRFHYHVRHPLGEPLGKVVLIHGMFGSMFSWRYTASFLQDTGYLVVAVDLPGFGFSDRRRRLDHSQQNRSRLVWKLLDTVDRRLDRETAAQPWHLVGHSAGAQTVTMMAAGQQGRTQSLIYVAPALTDRSRFWGRVVLSLPLVNHVVAAVLQRSFFTYERVKEQLASAYGRTPTDLEVLGYLEPLQLDGTAAALLDMMRRPAESLEGALAAIGQPTLVVWGEKDAWVPLDEAKPLLRALPHANLEVIPGSGHCPMETDSLRFHDLIAQFLADVS